MAASVHPTPPPPKKTGTQNGSTLMAMTRSTLYLYYSKEFKGHCLIWCSS